MEEKKDIFSISVKQKIWLHTIVFSFIVYIIFVFLNYFLQKSFDITTLTRALAGTSAILFGASFSLSGFCYYFDFLDKKISYRKYLGLSGYWFALFYSLSLLFLEPAKYFYGFFDNFFSADIFLGVISMAIFSFIAIISNDQAMIKLGPKLWRKLMRLGYVAWLLLVIRAWFIEKELWLNYLNTLEGFPPPRLLLSLFVFAVIFFRISIEINKLLKSKKTYVKGNE